jgi:spermidine/putrescine transport system permease protein
MMRPGTILIGLYAALAYGFIFLPVVVLVLFSFQESRLPIPPFDGPSLRWYGEIFSDGRLMAALVNSLVVALVSSALACGLAFLAAWGLARRLLPAGAAMRALITLPLTVSYLIIGLGLLASFNALGLPRSLLTVGIGHVVINLPLAFAILYASMGPRILNAERAARDLGASEARVLIHVTVPMLAPALIASYFLAVTFSWDEFIIAFLLSRFDVTLPVEIWSLLRSGLNPRTNAIGSLVFLVSVALVLLLEILVFRKARR